jgi:uncharacterized protein (TIGR00369 family)
MEQSIKPIKIKNAFAEKGTRDNYNCFGCSPYNKNGLQLEFWEVGEEIIAKWSPRKTLEGWQDVLHGGIQAVLMDELAGWIVLVKLKTSGVTSELNVKYLKPLVISKGEVTVRGKVISQENRLAKISLALYDGEGKECANAEAIYFCFPEKIARTKFHYPGHEAFYEK